MLVLPRYNKVAQGIRVAPICGHKAQIIVKGYCSKCYQSIVQKARYKKRHSVPFYLKPSPVV